LAVFDRYQVVAYGIQGIMCIRFIHDVLHVNIYFIYIYIYIQAGFRWYSWYFVGISVVFVVLPYNITVWCYYVTQVYVLLTMYK